MLVCYQGAKQYVTLKQKSLQRCIFDYKYEKQCKVKLKTVQRSGVVNHINNLMCETLGEMYMSNLVMSDTKVFVIVTLKILNIYINTIRMKAYHIG